MSKNRSREDNGANAEESAEKNLFENVAFPVRKKIAPLDSIEQP
jgi:hypothetical protein